MKSLAITFLCLIAAAAIAAPADGWKLADWVIKDEINDVSDGSRDLCNVFFREDDGIVYVKLTTCADIRDSKAIDVQLFDESQQKIAPEVTHTEIVRGVAEFSYRTHSVRYLDVQLHDASGIVIDHGFVDLRNRESLDNLTGNCAFVHHGNQGLTYTSVFRGNGGSTTAGFDEVLEVHQARGVPGNFHMSGTLITAAEWYDPSFNQWLRDGITGGYVAMLTSAYAQHIMPFVTNEMNNWAVNIEHDLIQTKYNYNTRVAWVPERVWLAGCCYPNGSLVDTWLGDNWQQHGVDAVILDDWPHVSGQSDRKIHWMNNSSGVTLRVIPIDGEFTGNVHYNPSAAIAQIQGTGQYGIVVYGTDWEAAAEMADFGCTDCLENYTQVINWAADNYPAVGVWKLDSALDNPDFNGWGINVGNGTYGLIGGDQGYGGSNNSWYADWAGTASHSDFHSPTVWNYGTVWTTAYNNLITAPSNNLSETGWYILMTNLHETAWHDNMGGPISGWEHRYSAHIKDANVYAEAARWAAGQYAIPVNAYFSDIDQDGVNELVIHNERVFAVFETIGGRAQWIFAKDAAGTVYNYSVVGSDNTYWAETDGDYDEPNSNNHQAAFAEVSPTYRDLLYTLAVDSVSPTQATIHMNYGTVSKSFRVDSGQPYLQANYDAGTQTCWIRHGFSPDLLDLIWNADMTRVWPPDVAYAGFRDPNTGATGALILGNGGAAHNLEFSGTLLRGEEIFGHGRFSYLLFAGATSAPDTVGHISELEALKSLNLDHFGPRLNAQAAFISNSTVEVTFSEAVTLASAQNPANWFLTGFSTSHSVTAAVRQSDWTRVRLTVSPVLAGGESGIVHVVANQVFDVNGNPVENAYSSSTLSAPSGLTPHTIVIDGTQDFDVPNEALIAGATDTLAVTWDSTALYIGYWRRDLATGDLFVHIDTNQLNNSGASSGSWGRETFANPYRIEYQVAIEGGPDNIQLNRWNGSAWVYQNFGVHTCTSYNGWSSNPFTEIKIPWNQIGNPTGIALAFSITTETTNQTLRALPPTNPIGNNITISQFYRLYAPYITGNLPLMGVRTKNTLSADLLAPISVVIQPVGGARRLTWPAVAGATSYVVYRATSLTGTYSQITETSALSYDDSEALAGTLYFYQVTAKGGL
jgi:hypothetical protein